MPAAYLSPDEYGLRVPTLREMKQRGAWSEGLEPVFPSVTYPAHTSIATGTNPGTHGITTNVAPDPLDKNDEGWRWYAEDIRVATLWSAARKRGLRTALVWWPVTVGAKATVVVPEIWRAGTPEDHKLVRALSTPPGVLAAVEKRFPRFWEGITPPRVRDESLTDAAVHVLETSRPHLLMLHIFDVDHEQHESGPMGPSALPAIEYADRQLARLVAAAKKAGIWAHTALVVVSDHGFLPITKRVRPGVLLREKGLVKLDSSDRVTESKAYVLASGSHAYVYLRDPQDQATREALREIFVPLAGRPGSGIGRVYTQEEIRRRGGDPEAFLALEGADGCGIQRGYAGEYIQESRQLGTHGFDTERPEMRASFLAYGPAIQPARIGPGRLIDVAPTIARWLGLALPQAEGKPLRIPLRAAAPSAAR